MFVIRLPNGNLMVPQSATGHDGRILGDVYVEIGPQDADYSRLAAQALTPEEAEQRRDRWRQDDEALRQEFLEFARLNGEYTWQDSAEGDQSCEAAEPQARQAADAGTFEEPPTEPLESPPEGTPQTGETAGGLIRLGVVRPPGGLGVLVRCRHVAGTVLQTHGTCGARPGFGCS